jgi:hypothetical protein
MLKAVYNGTLKVGLMQVFWMIYTDLIFNLR